jgi:hypothetical protein
MATIYADTSSALDSHLKSFATTNSLAVQWENKTSKRPNGTHLRQSLLPVESVQAELGSTGQDYNQNIYQVDVVVRADDGKKELYTKLDLVADHFARGTVLTYNSQKIRITRVEFSPLVFDTDFVYIAVSVTAENYTPAR